MKVQECLFIIQAELAGTKKSVKQSDIDNLEQTIGYLESKITNHHAFVVPGATELSALCDYSRAVSRRTERTVISSRSMCKVSPTSLAYLNRLSSFLYTMARYAACVDSVGEASPSY